MNEFTMGPSLLFCPGDRPDRFVKAAERSDAVILDLEDAVGQENKRDARGAIASAELDPARTIVRVNAVEEGTVDEDLDAVHAAGVTTVMLAKTESAADVERLGAIDVVALVETALGVANAREIAAHEHVVALMWGAEDLVASMGGTSSRRDDGTYRDVARLARASVLLAAKAEGKAAVDAIRTDIADTAGALVESRDAAASGFDAKACIHPNHVAPIREAFLPSEQDIAWARAVLAEAELHAGGVFNFNGRMIDEPILRHARKTVARTAHKA
ncbi:MAG TPA: CoA ester lyase [Candidatus Agrococcus pullicola]|uniref:CoA ester lyase n=1 Tax=Candidatus Agrococcus pullicola TaxID=2838429 RepID=A0A9D1YX40_9MICO|nr:CoA ester lyase [Candidatus Agrococcus pullicola]